MDKIACIIVNYNDWRRTINLVQTIIQYRILSHVIVVDNYSTDDSRQHLISYKNNKFVYIETEKNGGYGFGNNIGIKKAKELGDDYILISNPDVIFSENCLEDMLIKMKHNEKCAIINAVETYLGNCAWKYTSTVIDVLSTSIIFNKLVQARYYPKEKFQRNGVTEVDVIQGSFLLIPVDVMLQFGMYDEEFFLYEEEKVLYVKLKKQGFCFLTDLDVSYEHRHIEHGGKSVSQYVNGKKKLLDSKLLFLRKYRGITGIKLFLCKIFFWLTLFEMYLYAHILVHAKREMTCH